MLSVRLPVNSMLLIFEEKKIIMWISKCVYGGGVSNPNTHTVQGSTINL